MFNLKFNIIWFDLKILNDNSRITFEYCIRREILGRNGTNLGSGNFDLMIPGISSFLGDYSLLSFVLLQRSN